MVNKAAQLATLVRSAAHSLIVVANDGLGNQSSEVVIVIPAHTLNGNGNVSSRDGIVSYADLGANERRLLLGQDVGRVLR